MFQHFTTTVLAFALSIAAARAQTCTPAGIPIGQPGLFGFMPACVGTVPVPMPPGGNAGFAIAPGSLPIPPGSLQYLAISGYAPPPFASIPAGFLCAGFGLPGTYPMALLGVLSAGVVGPLPPPPVPLPIPPGFAPGTLFVTIQTVGFNLAAGCVVISNGTTVTN